MSTHNEDLFKGYHQPSSPYSPRYSAKNNPFNYQIQESVQIPSSDSNKAFHPPASQADINSSIHYGGSIGIPITNSEYPMELKRAELIQRNSIPYSNYPQTPISTYPQPLYTSYDHRHWGYYNPSPIYMIKDPFAGEAKDKNREQIKRAAPVPPVIQSGLGEDQKIRVLSDEIERQRGNNISTYNKFNELRIVKTDLKNGLEKIENEIINELKKSKNNETEIQKKILEDKIRELAFLTETRSKLTHDELNNLIWKVKETEIENGYLRERIGQLDQTINIMKEGSGNEIMERRITRR